MSNTRVLFAASEVYPFAKSGGLADVAHSLPRALRETCDVDVIMPLYQFIDREKFGIQAIGETFTVMMGENAYPVTSYICKYEDITYLFVYTPLLCDREFLYGPPQGGYEDNDIRFALFNYAILEMVKRDSYEIVHLNDWQTALLPLLLKNEPEIATKSLFTIHNLAYQGIFEKKAGFAQSISPAVKDLQSLFETTDMADKLPELGGVVEHLHRKQAIFDKLK